MVLGWMEKEPCDGLATYSVYLLPSPYSMSAGARNHHQYKVVQMTER